MRRMFGSSSMIRTLGIVRYDDVSERGRLRCCSAMSLPRSAAPRRCARPRWRRLRWLARCAPAAPSRRATVAAELRPAFAAAHDRTNDRDAECDDETVVKKSSRPRARQAGCRSIPWIRTSGRVHHDAFSGKSPPVSAFGEELGREPLSLGDSLDLDGDRIDGLFHPLETVAEIVRQRGCLPSIHPPRVRSGDRDARSPVAAMHMNSTTGTINGR